MIDLFEFLKIELINTPFIFLQLWSVVHFLAGFFLWKYFKAKPEIAIALIVGFEVIEPMTPLFQSESPIDTYWDLIVGILGYYTAKNNWIVKGGK